MTWTVILYNGNTYHREVFHGAMDSQAALKEAQEKFGKFWPPAVDVVAIVAGDHPVHLNK
jgi:hypothetical protein|tara:strand:- start:13 stop:192 length:180 start_codon:yes stop_codon:yes gene_type:complete